MVLVSMSTFMIFAIVFNGQKARILMKLDYNFNHGYQSKFFFFSFFDEFSQLESIGIVLISCSLDSDNRSALLLLQSVKTVS